VATTFVVIAGDPQGVGEVLEEALSGEGVVARYHPARSLEETLVGLEQRLERMKPAAVVAVGAGEAALALAVTAAKLSTPLAWMPDPESQNPDRSRVIAALAWLEVDGGIARATDLIVAWIRDDTPTRNLDSPT
jgi:hypothetical protein